MRSEPDDARAERTLGPAHLFPPTLVPLLRERIATKSGSLAEVRDDVLVELLTTIFFAGLETYEGERNAIRVAFFGPDSKELVAPEGHDVGSTAAYRWRVLRFEDARPFVAPELVKLAVASADGRIYSAVRVLPDGRLAIAGLAREGVSLEPDPCVKVIASRPGCLSIRSGHERLLEYERGAVLSAGEDVVLSARRVRGALERSARAAGLGDEGMADYLDAVRALVGEMAAHGRGGILVVSSEEDPEVAEAAPYRMAHDASLTSLLRLSGRIRHHAARRSRPPPDPDSDEQATSALPESISFGHLLRSAFLTEAERVVEELGALTAIDGATVLSRSLSLVAFGVVLPIGARAAVVEATGGGDGAWRTIAFGSRGTRHRAAAAYAAAHPGSVLFVASEDGEASCLLAESRDDPVLLWHLRPADLHGM